MTGRYLNGPLFGLALLAATQAAAQRIATWTEGHGELGLGYPVPVAMDSPLPFDGFRSYHALLARHLDLANRNDFIERHVIGATEAGQRDINLFIISDSNAVTITGLSEAGMLITGGIHAREWASPEVVTGVLETLAEQAGDGYFHQYLVENHNIAVIPVMNVDGLLQTQRTPARNYLDSDPGSPGHAPRDGRMRRKNMRGADEVLETAEDHLAGIDINRNFPPFRATSSRSSANPDSLLFHGEADISESESVALFQAPDILLPGSTDMRLADRLRLYIDIHSFLRTLLPDHTFNTARNGNQATVMQLLVDHHRAIPGGKRYVIPPPEGASRHSMSAGSGIGASTEHFAYELQIPAWTLELEPGNAGAVEYGGFGVNAHDGFIMPDAEIARVRRSMTASLLATAYWSAGPPAVERIRIIDRETESLILAARYAAPGQDAERPLQTMQFGTLRPDRDYILELTFDKPMRWLDEGGDIAAFPGRPDATLDISIALQNHAGAIELGRRNDMEWPLTRGFFDGGFARYRTDTVRLGFTLGEQDIELLADPVSPVKLVADTTDMAGLQLDAQPSSAVDWRKGDWTGYQPDSNVGEAIGLDVQRQAGAEPFAANGLMAGTWNSLGNSGVGYILEPLADGRVVIAWATFDEAGGQRWLVGVGRQAGNRIIADNMTVTGGARFMDFDPDDVHREAFAGSLEFIFESCGGGTVQFHGFGQAGRRVDLVNTTRVAGAGCAAGDEELPALAEASGSWFDPSRNGEGFSIHVLPDGRVVMFWYTFDNDGNQIWFTGVGSVDENTGMIHFAALTRANGARFGNAFNPEDVTRSPAGEATFTPACDSGVLQYAFTDPDLGSGELQLARLTRIAGIPGCS